MQRATLLLTALALVCATALPSAEAAKGKGKRKTKTKAGVFGTINGKAFKAPNRGISDACVRGTYIPGQNILTVQAAECKGKHRPKKNQKVIVISCLRARASDAPLVPPYDMPCPASAYTETRTGRFGAPISTTTWTADFSYDAPTFTTGSNLRARVDAFDGTTISGAIYGAFTTPVSGPGSETPATISGEIRFSLPVTVQ